MKRSLYFLILFTVYGRLLADLTNASDQEIKYLLNLVAESECVFNRNGTDYKGSEAVTHIQRKREYFEAEIKSAEDFIALSATKSEMSGRTYTVRCASNETYELGKWLLNALKSFRMQK